MAQSADPSATTSTPNLFPTTTANNGGGAGTGPGSANVYYLVVSLSDPSYTEEEELMIVSRCACYHSNAGCMPGIQGI